jgi:hypothetical protein
MSFNELIPISRFTFLAGQSGSQQTGVRNVGCEPYLYSSIFGVYQQFLYHNTWVQQIDAQLVPA